MTLGGSSRCSSSMYRLGCEYCELADRLTHISMDVLMVTGHSVDQQPYKIPQRDAPDSILTQRLKSSCISTKRNGWAQCGARCVVPYVQDYSTRWESRQPGVFDYHASVHQSALADQATAYGESSGINRLCRNAPCLD